MLCSLRVYHRRLKAPTVILAFTGITAKQVRLHFFKVLDDLFGSRVRSTVLSSLADVGFLLCVIDILLKKI